MMANGAMGSGGIWLGGVLSVLMVLGVALLAFWFYRFIKDTPQNKQVLAWALGLLVGVFAFANLTVFGYGGIMSGRASGSSMMGNMMKSVMRDPDVSQEMREMMQGVWENTNRSGY